MMKNTSIKWVELSDMAIIQKIGDFIKHTRLQQNITQDQLASDAGLNRNTISQIENGESVTLASFIQILRALDCLHAMATFEISEVISPLEYAKLKTKQKVRARSSKARKEKGTI